MFVKMSQDVKLLISLFLPLFLIYGVQHVYLVYGNLIQSYGISHEATGWILSVYFLAAMAIRPLGGWLLENFGIRKTIVCGGMLSFIGCSLFFFKQPVALLLLGRAMSGAGFGICSTGLFSYQGLCVSEKMRGAMFSLLVVGGVLPISTITPIGEWLLLNSHDTLFFAIGPILSALCCYLGGRINVTATGQMRYKEDKPWGTYSELFSSRTFLFLVLTGTIIGLVDALMISISLLSAEKGIAASYFLASLSIAAVTVRLAGSPILNVIPRIVLFAPCGILMSCSVIFASFFPARSVFILTGALFGIGIGAGWPMYHSLIGDLLDAALLPKGSATALLLFDGGYFVTPLVVGYLLPHFGIAWTFASFSLTMIGALLLIEVFYWLPLYMKK